MMHHNEILEKLTQNIAELCGLDTSEFDSTTPFVEIGLDSLMMTKLTQFVQDTFGVAVEPRQLFEEGASVEALTELIAQQAPATTAPEPALTAAAAMPQSADPLPAGQAAAPPPPSVLPTADHAAALENGSPLQRLFAQQLQLMSQQMQLLQREAAGRPPAMAELPAGGSTPTPKQPPAPRATAPRRTEAPKPAATLQPVAEPQPAAAPKPPPQNRPALSQIVRQIQDGQVEEDLPADLQQYAELVPEMEELSLLYVLEAFAEMGWQAQAGDSISTPELAASLAVESQHHRLLGRLLEMLGEAGYLKSAGDDWEVSRQLTADSSATRFTDLRQRFPNGELELSVLDRCGRNLAGVLRGQCDPLGLLFPTDGPDVGQIYGKAPASKLLNDLAGQAVAAELAQWPDDRMVRILEIGAGTGGTTTAVLPRLPQDRTDYVFTDISPAFLAQARKKFSDFPFARYLPLDLEEDPCEQGFEPGQFDLILAANVLHATQDLQQSLAHVRKLLAPQGLLIMLENVGRQRWADLTVGLTDGWWRFRDTEIRPDYPLVSEDTWQSLLGEAGFDEAADALCALESDRDGARHPLILGRASSAEESLGDISQMVGWFKLPEVQTRKLSDRQRAHLEKLSARYITRTRLSKRLTDRYRPKLVDSRALFGFRMNTKEMHYPVYATRSEGSRIEDIDGNEYIDLTMGFGVNLFGHRPPFVQAALEEQLQMGIQIGPQTILAGEVAELVSEVAGVERVNFCNTGSEAVMVAMRVARTAAKRDTIVLFQSHFHGTLDGVLAMGVVENGRHYARPKWAGITPGHVQEVMVLEFDNPRSLDIIAENADHIGAVMVEPVQSANPLLQAREFLHQLRQLTLEKDIVLIFDEMVTGFRLHPRGAQGWFDVEADLVTYGKLIGGGMPMSVVAGKAEYLDRIDGGRWQYGDASYPEVQPTFTGGTFSKHPLALAASRAVLRHLKQEGPALQETLNQRTDRLAARVNRLFENYEVPGKIANCGSMMRFMFSQDMELFFYHLSNKGVYIWEGRGCFISTAHTEEDVDQVVQAIQDSILEMREGGFLPPLKAEGRSAATPAAAALPSCLVKLRGEGTQPPLFLAPGVYGTSYYLSNLVRCMDEEQPVYGLQARGLKNGEVPRDSIQGMARDFVEAIRSVSPEGPVRLGGHSTGAVVALETALQLQELGRDVEVLAVLDNPPFQKDNPMTNEHQDYTDAQWMDKYALGINPTSESKLAPYEELKALPPEELWTTFADWLRAAGQLAASAPAAHARNVLEVFKVSSVAELVYRPGEIYRGAVTLFRAADAMGELYDTLDNAAELFKAGGLDHPTMFWSEVCSRPVEVIEAPGDHLSMVFEPNCQTLAKRLSEVLASSRQEESESSALALAAS